jgi:RHS repeat-associated protein
MWTWNSDPFGTDAANPNPSGAGVFSYNLRFPGQVFDGQAGLHQNGRRWYDPAVGGYSQSDPSGLAAESHTTYAYVGGNPVSLVDPFGLWAAVAVSGNQVSITLPIQYSGPGVSLDRIRDWNKAIQQAWTGTFGRYHVVTTVTNGPQNQVNVKCGYGDSNTPFVGPATWFSLGRDKNTNPLWIPPHEAGHLMGLTDQYWGGGPAAGWEHDIMGALGQPPSARDISEIIYLNKGNK